MVEREVCPLSSGKPGDLSMCLHQLFSKHRHKGFHVGLRSPAQRIGSSNKSHHESHSHAIPPLAQECPPALPGKCIMPAASYSPSTSIALPPPSGSSWCWVGAGTEQAFTACAEHALWHICQTSTHSTLIAHGMEGSELSPKYSKIPIVPNHRKQYTTSAGIPQSFIGVGSEVTYLNIYEATFYCVRHI